MARDLLLEIGAEEIPASFIGPALEELRKVLTDKMAESRLKHGEVRTFGSPRRLAVLVRDVADAGEDVTREVLGPSAKVAFDAEGKPTQTAVKFAEGKKLPIDALIRIQTPKGEYVPARAGGASPRVPPPRHPPVCILRRPSGRRSTDRSAVRSSS